MIRALLLALAAVCASADAELNGTPCNEPGYDQRWRCHTFTTPAIEGTLFQVRLRWNRLDQLSTATAVWLAGGDGSVAHNDFDNGIAGAADPRSIRQRLADDFGLRSIELQFLNPPDKVSGLGGYWAAPQRGFIKPAQAFVATLDYLNRPEVDLLRGDWITAVGSSNSSTAIAFALAYLDAAAQIDRAVFISGPFWGDVLRECRDQAFEAWVGQNDSSQLPKQISSAEIYSDISAQNGWPDCRAQGLNDFQRSALGEGAERQFPGLDIDVIVGELDEYGPWLIRSNYYWYRSVSAGNLSRTVLAGIDHQPWGVDPDVQRLLVKTVAKPPGVAAEGLFTVADRAIYYSNGARHCYFPTMALYQQLTGRSDSVSLSDYRALPDRSVDDGVCGQPAGGVAGLFKVNSIHIYYSNGSHYCYFPTVERFRQLTGRETSAGLADYASVPSTLVFDGDCRG